MKVSWVRVVVKGDGGRKARRTRKDDGRDDSLMRGDMQKPRLSVRSCETTKKAGQRH